MNVTAKMIARLAYGYELMFSQMCHIAGTSGGSPHWFTEKGQEMTARVDPLWKLSEESNAGKPGDCLSQYEPFAAWAADVEKKAQALEHWRQEVGKLHSQDAAKDEVLREAYTALAFAFNRIHASSRTRDGELAADLAKVRGRIEKVLGPALHGAPAEPAKEAV